MTTLRLVSDSTTAVTQTNDNFKAVSVAGLYGYNAFTTTGLNFGYYGGQFNGVTVADSTVALTASTTNYVVAHLTTGAVTAATNTTNWTNTGTYLKLFTVVTGASTITSWEDYRQSFGAPATVGALTQYLPVACSDETTAVSTGTAKCTFHMPYTGTITQVWAGLTTAQTSGSIFTVDVNKNGTTILSTKITIDNTESTSLTAATAPVISVSAVTKGDAITIDIDQIGDGTAKGLKVYFQTSV